MIEIDVMLLRHTFLLQHAGILEALPVRVVFTSSHSSTRAVGMFPSRDVTTSWRILLSLVPSHLEHRNRPELLDLLELLLDLVLLLGDLNDLHDALDVLVEL